jgi:HEAT repeat protein
MSRDDDVRAVAAAADELGRLGGRGAREELERLLAADDPRLRASALSGLRRLGDADAVAAIVPLLGDERPIPPAGEESREGGRVPLRMLAAAVIDELAGEPLDGDPERVRAWLASRPR